MTKQELLNLVDKLADKFYGAGVSNPITYIEQISFLFFLKMLEEQDDAGVLAAKISKRISNPIYSGVNERYRWSSWSQIPDNQKMYEFLRNDVLKFTENIPNRSDIKRFFSEVRFMIPDAITLREVVDLISPINFSQIDTDVKGDMYEHLVGKLAASGRNGQFRTPRHIIRTIIQMVDPKLGQTVLDPACGTAGFLLAAFEYIKANNSEEAEKITANNGSKYLKGHGDNLSENDWEKLVKNTFWGFDVSPDITKIAWMNMVLHGLDVNNVYRRDSLAGASDEFETMSFDVVLANPPFAADVALERLRPILPIQAKDSTVLFLGLMVDSLKPGGRCGVIVNEGVLFGRNKASIEIRKYILDKTELQAVVSLPQGVFNPYAGVKTSFLIFKNTGKPTGKVWFYDVENDGYSKGTQRRPQPDKNDLPDLFEKWKTKVVSGKSWIVDKKRIEENDFILSASAYKPASSVEQNHRDPKEILKEIDELESQLSNQGKIIKKLL